MRNDAQREPGRAPANVASEELLERIRRTLEPIFGRRLEGVVLFGSEARGEAGLESDIDLMLLLHGPIAAWDDIYAATRALGELQGEIGRGFHIVPADAASYEAGECSLYRAALREGIRI